MKFAIAALLGAVSATQRPVWDLRSINDHRTDSGLIQSYGAHSVSQADARDPMSSDDPVELVMINGDYYKPFNHGKGGQLDKYERVTPVRFATGDDDIFMRSMIQNYALEGKVCEEDDAGKEIKDSCKPDGHFWMNEAGTKAAAAEVLSTHKSKETGDVKEYLATYFPRTWAHFDVNGAGVVDVIKMPQFMRFLASDQRMSLGENGF